jgi:hypothetical protein
VISLLLFAVTIWFGLRSIRMVFAPTDSPGVAQLGIISDAARTDTA